MNPLNLKPTAPTPPPLLLPTLLAVALVVAASMVPGWGGLQPARAPDHYWIALLACLGVMLYGFFTL